MVLAIASLVVFIILTITSFFLQNKITKQFKRMTETTIITHQLLETAVSIPFAVSEYEMIRLPMYREKIDQLVSEIQNKLTYLNDTIHDQYGIAQLAILNGHFESFFHCLAEITNYLSQGGRDTSLYFKEIYKNLDSIQLFTQQLNLAELHYFRDQQQLLDRRILRAWTFSILLFVIFGFWVGIIIRFLNQAANAIVKISRYAQNVADGNFMVQSLKMQSNDEISVLAESFNKMTKDLLGFRDNIRENLPLLREYFFRQLALGKIQTSDLPLYLAKLELEINNYCTAILIQLDDYYLTTLNFDDKELVVFKNEFSKKILSALKDYASVFCFENNPGEIVLCVCAEAAAETGQKLKEILKKIRAALDRKYSATIAVGNEKDSILSFADSYNEALEALRYKFILGRNQDIYYSQLAGRFLKHEAFPRLVSYEAELIRAVRLADLKLIEQKITELIQELRTHGASAQFYFEMIIGNIYLQALQALERAGGNIEEMYEDPLKVYRKIISHQTLDGMGEELFEVLNEIVDFINLKKEKKYYHAIAKAEEYILQNYHRGDLSLEEVANLVNISTCYFSLIFKQEVGMSFADYLTKVRLEKAKELLAMPGALSYEVAYQVGYNNPTYFSRVFKKHVGFSPTEFKNSLQKVN